MKVLVVYESMWGNTERVARAIAAGLAESIDVAVVDAASAPVQVGPDVALVVAGGPTHAFSMSRPGTRDDAVSQGAPQEATRSGLREWLDAVHGAEVPMATFDTRIDKARHFPGSAAKSAARVARRHGSRMVARPESFYVYDVSGPLLEGETDRALVWGRTLATSARAAQPVHGQG